MFSLSLSLKFPDAHFNESLLGNAFDSMQLPSSDPNNRGVMFPTIHHKSRYQARKRVFLTYFRDGLPKAESLWRSRNVSDPQLISSTNYMRESWYLNFGSAHTIGDLATLSSDNVNFCATITTTVANSASPDQFASLGEFNHYRPVSGNIFKQIQPGGSSDDDDNNSLYSLESADPDAHNFLLSIPIIPQIKLERKATLRKVEPEPSIDLDDAVYNGSLLSPRILRPQTLGGTQKPSRRYGQIGMKTSANTLAAAGVSEMRCNRKLTANDQGPSTLRTSRRLGSTDWSGYVRTSTAAVYRPSVSEPTLNTSETTDDIEGKVLPKEDFDFPESPHCDVLISIIDEMELDVDMTPRHKLIPAKHSKCNHRRSPATNLSLSSNNSVQTVTVGCSSPKTKTQVPVSNLHVTPKWAPENGQIIIKIFVPSTDDIWKLRVPHNITLSGFTSTVTSKLGFPVAFSGSCWDGPEYYLKTDAKFRWWVERRVRFGRNLPIVAQIAESPLVSLD